MTAADALMLKAAQLAAKKAGQLIAKRYEEHRLKRVTDATACLAEQLSLCADGASAEVLVSEADLTSLDLLEEYFFNWMSLIDPAAQVYVARLTALSAR